MRVLWICIKAAMIGLALLLLLGYFGEHVRDAGGSSLAAVVLQ